jgi:hypothetical protein
VANASKRVEANGPLAFDLAFDVAFDPAFDLAFSLLHSPALAIAAASDRARSKGVGNSISPGIRK